MTVPAKLTCYTVPVASTSFLDEAYWDGATSSIRFAYSTEPLDDGKSRQREVKIKFARPMLVAKRAESFCRVEHIEGCYDTLVEVVPSAWVEAEYTDEVKRKTRLKEAHHYMIYLDSIGCFELLAEAFTVEDQLVDGSRGVQ